MKPIGSNSPENESVQILRTSSGGARRSVAMPGVSKDGSSYRRLRLSFETHRLCDAPQSVRNIRQPAFATAALL